MSGISNLALCFEYDREDIRLYRELENAGFRFNTACSSTETKKAMPIKAIEDKEFEESVAIYDEYGEYEDIECDEDENFEYIDYEYDDYEELTEYDKYEMEQLKKDAELLERIEREEKIKEYKRQHIDKAKKLKGEDFRFFEKMFSYRGQRQVRINNPNSDIPFQLAFFCKPEQFCEKIDGFSVLKSYDTYLTKNPFFADRRETKYLSAFDNIVIDLDNHHINPTAVKHEVERLMYYLAEEYEGIPYPTLTVYTGRGVQLWYSIESTAVTEHWTNVYNAVAHYLCDVFIKMVSECDIDLEVDRGASVNIAGLVRMPCTYNTKAETYSYVYDNTGKIYDLKDLYAEINECSPFEKRQNVDIEKCKKFKSEAVKTFKKQGDYTGLHIKRINFIEDYVKSYSGNVKGRRNSISFLYYNECKQVYNDDVAVEKLIALTEQFTEKYSDSEIKAIIRKVDRKIYDKISNQYFIEKLELTTDEEQAFSETSSRKKSTKTLIQKKQERNERDERIYELAYCLYSQQEIAQKVGCSVRTVKSVFEELGIKKSEIMRKRIADLSVTMSVKEIADELNCSERTVANYLNEIKKANVLTETEDVEHIEKDEEKAIVGKKMQLVPNKYFMYAHSGCDEIKATVKERVGNVGKKVQLVPNKYFMYAHSGCDEIKATVKERVGNVGKKVQLVPNKYFMYAHSGCDSKEERSLAFSLSESNSVLSEEENRLMSKFSGKRGKPPDE